VAPQEHLARLGVCLAMSPGEPDNFSHRFEDAAAEANYDIWRPAIMTVFGSRNVDWAEYLIRR
jgi:hypothetical protein